MWNLFKRTKDLALTVSDHCGRLCDDACRRAALRQRVLLQQIWRGIA